MDATEKIQPALTPEEWSALDVPSVAYLDKENYEEPYPFFVVDHAEGTAFWSDDPKSRHALAALALYGQPFGFTREDVHQLRERVAGCRETAEAQRDHFYTDKARVVEGIAEALESLAARIEVLLPPEK